MLRDRLVCGVNDKRIQRSLLSETKLSYKRALEFAQAMEAAECDTQELQYNKPAGVNVMQPNSSQRKGTVAPAVIGVGVDIANLSADSKKLHATIVESVVILLGRPIVQIYQHISSIDTANTPIDTSIQFIINNSFAISPGPEMFLSHCEGRNWTGYSGGRCNRTCGSF